MEGKDKSEETDVFNVAIFGVTDKQWREANPEQKGNIRDYATINELICLKTSMPSSSTMVFPKVKDL